MTHRYSARVLIYAGIDEAGYGPMLGPLCVAATVFEIDDHDPDTGAPDLWKRLNRIVCRRKSDARGRIAIDDSKKLKGARDGEAHPLKHLERGVLSFLAAARRSAESDDDLLAALASSPPTCAWYQSRTALPVGCCFGELSICRARATRDLEAAGVRCTNMRCEVIDAGAFNHDVQRMGNKASVNFCRVLKLIDEVWRANAGSHPRIVVDRQSGRMRYMQDLHHAWPEAEIQVLDEDETLSRYRLREGGREMTVSFQVEAEARHLPVALASMTAKYVRELMMLRLNRFFAQHVPELKPTAGYVQDGRRFVGDIKEAVRRLEINERDLVRTC